MGSTYAQLIGHTPAISELSLDELEMIEGAKQSTWLYNAGSMFLGAGAGALLGGVTSPAAPIAGAFGLALIGAGAASEAAGY